MSRMVEIEVMYDSSNKSYLASAAYIKNGKAKAFCDIGNTPVRNTANQAMLMNAIFGLSAILDKTVAIQVVGPRYIYQAIHGKGKANPELVALLKAEIAKFPSVTIVDSSLSAIA